MQATRSSNDHKPTRGFPSRALIGLATAVAALGFASATASPTTLVGWEMNVLSNAGPSPFAPTATATNLTSTGLIRGSGVGSATAGNGWGGNGFNVADLSAAVSAEKFATFTIAPAENFAVSLDSITPFSHFSGPPMSFLNGLHPKSDFLAVKANS
jgi:hypothetical protein